MMKGSLPAFSLLTPPYSDLCPLDARDGFRVTSSTSRGAALVWSMEADRSEAAITLARERPPGVALLVVLPVRWRARRDVGLVLRAIEYARPATLLPPEPVPEPRELARLLLGEPASLAGELMDFLRWRGLELDRETQRIVCSRERRGACTCRGAPSVVASAIEVSRFRRTGSRSAGCFARR
jgi:hypothetical protein